MLGQIAMSSVFHKHLWVASASQETPTLSDASLVVKLMATAVIFVGLRLYVDKEALKLVSSIFFKMWMFAAILMTPLVNTVFIRQVRISWIPYQSLVAPLDTRLQTAVPRQMNPQFSCAQTCIHKWCGLPPPPYCIKSSSND